MDQEKISTPVPIVEHLPNGQEPHPNTDGWPEGTVGHPGEHLEHQPVENEGQIVAAPPGHGVQVETVPSSDEVEKMLKEGSGETGRWRAVAKLRELLKLKKTA